jgi:trans-2,3-dihydro-3-hydroxyanthranilate isomerase
MQRHFTTLDVFTNECFAGNPLAVVSGSEDLDAARMQAIAREFGLPETVFVFPATHPAHTAHLHIFTPATELPFAGHPTVGTAVVIALSRRNRKPQDLILEEQIGLVRCHVTPKGTTWRMALELPVLPRQLAWRADPTAIAAALGISPADIDSDWFAPEKWSAGIGLCMVPVKNAAALAGASPDVSGWEDAFGKSGPRAVYVFCRHGDLPATSFRARMFAPFLGVREDPATGSAAAASSGRCLTAHGGLGAGAHKVIIEQGREMGRPSTIELELQIDGAKLTAASIGGDAVIVSQGTLKA